MSKVDFDISVEELVARINARVEYHNKRATQAHERGDMIDALYHENERDTYRQALMALEARS